MAAWYDFDNSGGFNWGDVGAGLSQAGTGLASLFSSSGGGDDKSNGWASVLSATLPSVLTYRTQKAGQKQAQADSNFYKGLAADQYARQTTQEDAAQSGLEGVDFSGFTQTDEEKKKQLLADSGRNVNVGA